MKLLCSASLAGLVVLLVAGANVRAQNQREVRRAQPAGEPPATRALPVEEATATPARPADPNTPTDAADVATDPRPPEIESPDKRQLEYANGLFTRKLYDLAVPEYQKYLDQYPDAPGRANACFGLGESHRALNRTSSARTALQRVLSEFPESEFAGPAAYALAGMAFTEKNYNGALPLFHRAAAKSKEPAVALSAKYFEARCLETVGRKDEARDIYLEVIDAKNPNAYRDDARLTVASIYLGGGRKAEALKQLEAVAGETQNASLKAEATVRAGMLALDLIQGAQGKTDKAMSDKAAALFQKGRTLPEAGRWKAIAQVGLLRLHFQTGQFSQLLTDYKKTLEQAPEDARAEMMLLAANSHRQLGHTEKAEEIYKQIIAKYPSREEAKDARYQRLINIYNANDPALLAEIEAYFNSNPTLERADQAKLLKAEALYKQQNFGEAAPVYEQLRASQLSTKLRAESAYKLGWCYVQLKNTPKIVEAFSYFIKAFPDNPQAPAAYAQRALAYQQEKNYEAALSDLNALLTNFSRAKEREAALQQKALILGQQENSKGMSDAFQQLLKEFPKTPIAAQAHYYIGKAAFEAKEYKVAIRSLDLARQLNKEQFQNLATLRIISSHFYLKERKSLTVEVDALMKDNPEAAIPPEILEWLGIEFYNEKSYAEAILYLGALARIDNPQGIKPDFLFYLGDAAHRIKNFPEAESAFAKYLATATDPAGKAKVLLALGAVKIGAHKADEAQKIAEEIMSLQPEGRVNAEARLLAGEVQLEREHYTDAGKAFMGVALLYDDPTITPRALEKAALAYQKAGNQAEADRAARQLRERFPNYVGG